MTLLKSLHRWRRQHALAFAIGTLVEAADDVRAARDEGCELDAAIAHVEQALASMRKALEVMGE